MKKDTHFHQDIDSRFSTQEMKLTVTHLKQEMEKKDKMEIIIKQLITKRKQKTLARHLLSIVADSTGFLLEDRLQELLAPYTDTQKTLVYLHNIFSVSIMIIILDSHFIFLINNFMKFIIIIIYFF